MPGTKVAAYDGLRGVAVAAVVAFHLGRFSGGWLGVDAFFTLSGFLITSLLLARAEREGGVDLRSFWRRRVRRLQPAALVLIAVVVASASWWAVAGTGKALRGDALASMFAVQNWHLLWSNQPYAAGATRPVFEHFWSLAIEEQFYLVWPLLVFGIVAATQRNARRWVFALAVSGTIGSWTLLALSSTERGYLSTFTRVGSILAGAALACLLPLGQRAQLGRRTLAVIGIVGMGGMLALWCFAGWPPNMPLAVILPLHALCTLAVIVAAPVFLTARPLVGLGIVSYGVYLWHWPIIVIFTPHRLGRGELVTDLVRLGLIAVATAASWYLVEHPVRRGQWLSSTRKAFPVGAAIVVAAVLLGAATVASAPVWARADGSLVTTNTPVAKVAEPAQPVARHHPRRVLLVGDSVATSLLSTTDATGGVQMGRGRILEQFAKRGVRAASATLTGCPVVDQAIVADNTPRAYCQESLDRVLPRAMQEFRPDLVVWYSSSDTYAVEYPDGTRGDPVASPEEAQRLVDRYDARLRWFADRGAHVVFVSPGPNRDGHNVEDIRRDTQATALLTDDIVRQVAQTHPDTVVSVVAMSDLTCPDWRATHSCADAMPNGDYYRGEDGTHFEGQGAIDAGRWLTAQIAALTVPAVR